MVESKRNETIIFLAFAVVIIGIVIVITWFIINEQPKRDLRSVVPPIPPPRDGT